MLYTYMYNIIHIGPCLVCAYKLYYPGSWYFNSDCQYVKKLLLSIWRPRDWHSHGSILFPLQTFQTSCPRETNLLRCSVTQHSTYHMHVCVANNIYHVLFGSEIFLCVMKSNMIHNVTCMYILYLCISVSKSIGCNFQGMWLSWRLFSFFPQVARHLAKLFDSMSSLKFTEDGSSEPTKEAVGMYSKDGEYVPFDSNCQCVGQVCVSQSSTTQLHAVLYFVMSYIQLIMYIYIG